MGLPDVSSLMLTAIELLLLGLRDPAALVGVNVAPPIDFRPLLNFSTNFVLDFGCALVRSW